MAQDRRAISVDPRDRGAGRAPTRRARTGVAVPRRGACFRRLAVSDGARAAAMAGRGDADRRRAADRGLAVARLYRDQGMIAFRSEESRVGKECVSKCRYRGWASHTKKKQKHKKRNI